jgi:hypothetical protein
MVECSSTGNRMSTCAWPFQYCPPDISFEIIVTALNLINSTVQGLCVNYLTGKESHYFYGSQKVKSVFTTAITGPHSTQSIQLHTLTPLQYYSPSSTEFSSGSNAGGRELKLTRRGNRGIAILFL